METVLVVPVVFDKTICNSDVEEAMKLTEQRDNLLDLGYTIKETRLVAFNHGVYAHYVMRKEEKNENN
jgi:hypothetical protein